MLMNLWHRLIGGREPGQVLVLFALASIPIMGFVGLSVDGGNILMQRRMAQNGADAGALGAVRDIARGSPMTASSTIDTYVYANAGNSGGGTTVTITKELLNNSGTVVGSSEATGVRVTVRKVFPTYFIRIIGFETFPVEATARGTVQLFTGCPGCDPPFLVCETPLKQSDGLIGPNLLLTTSPPTVNPALVNQEFILHMPQLGQNNGGCDWANSADFKGNAAPTSSGCPYSPCYMQWSSGNKSGPTRQKIAGGTVCADNSTLNNCISVLPIVVDRDNNLCTDGNPNPVGSDPMCVIAWVAFSVREGNPSTDPNPCNASNCHVGRLLGTVVATEGQGSTWTPGTQGVLIPKLTF